MTDLDKILKKIQAKDTRTPEEKKAAAEKYSRLRIDAKVPLENVITNGHKFIIGKTSWDKDLDYDPDKELRIWGTNADPEDPSSKQYISISGTYSSCWRCGSFVRYTYDADANTLVATAERFEYPGYEGGDLSDKENYKKWAQSRVSVFNDGPCPVTSDIETVVRVAFESGRVIVDDSLRQVYDPNFDDYDYNSTLGQAVAIERNAEVGCAYFPVGNSCPSIYKLEDGSYIIGSPEYDEETDEPKDKGWVEIAGICTDLWAASLADYEDWLAKGGTPIEEDNQYGTRQVIDLEPGVYEFTYYRGREDWKEYDGDTIYASFKKVDN